MLRNIPEELRRLRQWVCARHDKNPLCPATGLQASVTDPSTWGSFEEAAGCCLPHIGFVLTAADPYAIIDLDDKPAKPLSESDRTAHTNILAAFNTYTERSASGRGYHIILRGAVPAGLHRGSVELYSSLRYMICTGNVVRSAPIADCSKQLAALVGEIQTKPLSSAADSAAIAEDAQLWETARSAVNGAKFCDLCSGLWRDLGYPSQSEADYALLSMFAFYSPNNAQVRRMFRLTELGRRQKATKNDVYLNRSLRRIRSNQPPQVSIEAIVDKLEESTDDDPEPEGTGDYQPLFTLPPGIIGDLTSYIYTSSIRPVPEVALAAALALTAGVCGRSYNVSGSGLNQYLILVAKTGAGKDGAVAGIDRLIAAVRKSVPAVDQFIGPSVFSSGQALIRVLDERPCFVSVLGEFGLTVQQLCDPRANAAQIMLKRVLLDLYSKSGSKAILRSTVYADTDKNTKIIQAPNVTILGESTPETLFDRLDQTHIAEGLIPRFSVIEYKGPRPPRNKGAHLPPDDALVARLAQLVAINLSMAQNHAHYNVPIEDDAYRLLDALDTQADSTINSASSDIDMQLWNRAHLKALKLSALLAVGVNPSQPRVTGAEASWAVDFVKRDVGATLARFSQGEVGTGEHRHEAEIRRAVTAYLAMAQHKRMAYKVSAEVAALPVVPFGFIRRWCRLRAAFKDDRRGTAKAIADAVADLLRCGILVTVSPLTIRCEAYAKGAAW